jgi:3'-5' exoribonuclease
MTLEALLVHYIDTIDSRVASWLEIMERDPNENWTEPAKLYDRHLWKGPVPTERQRSPIEGRSARRARTKARPQKSAEARDPNLAFKPLHELAPRASPRRAEPREQPREDASAAVKPEQHEGATETSELQRAEISVPSSAPLDESPAQTHPSES